MVYHEGTLESVLQMLASFPVDLRPMERVFWLCGNGALLPVDRALSLVRQAGIGWYPAWVLHDGFWLPQVVTVGSSDDYSGTVFSIRWRR
jgi:hypothetical protein